MFTLALTSSLSRATKTLRYHVAALDVMCFPTRAISVGLPLEQAETFFFRAQPEAAYR
jgi:hypothetical protein